MRRLGILLAVVVIDLSLASFSWASTTTPGPMCDRKDITHCGSARGDDGVTIVISAPVAGTFSETGAALGQSAGLDYYRREYTPTCTGNSRLYSGTSCPMAVTSCPLPGFVRFWIFEAKFDGTTNQIIGDWSQVTSPTTVCLGPGAPGIPKPVVIAATVQRDFKRLVVLQGVVKVQPAGTTLVNFDTVFYTEAGAYDLPVVTILGSVVRVRATPIRYDWFFGDGGSAPDAGPGARGRTDVAHRYARTGQVGPYIVITWSGTYTVDGGAGQPVTGTAQTTGPPTALQVAQARSELVSR